MLDSSGRIVYSNKALAEWLEIDEDRLPGMKCIWAGKDPENMLNRLAIPPQAKNLPVYHATVTIGSGEKESNRAAIFMALNDHAELGATLVVLEEVESVAAEKSPFDADSLHRSLALLRQSWSEPYSLDQIIGESTAIRKFARRFSWRRSRKHASSSSATKGLVEKPLPGPFIENVRKVWQV